MQTALSAKGRSFAAEELQQHLQLKPHVLDHIIDWGMADRPVNERLVLLSRSAGGGLHALYQRS